MVVVPAEVEHKSCLSSFVITVIKCNITTYNSQTIYILTHLGTGGGFVIDE